MFKILTSKKFFFLFITQFFGALNDNIFKNALVIFITYKLAHENQINSQFFVTLAAFLFILPFFLFSALAGQIADKFDKAKIAQIIKFAEIILMIFAFYGFYTKNLYFLLFILFALGAHSAFFGPIKYGILPKIVKENELIAANSLISSATFAAILLGTIIGGILIMTQNGIFAISATVISSAIIGFVTSFFIPKQKPNQLKISFNIFTQSLKIMAQTRKNPKIFQSIMAISWFWFIGSIFLSQIANFSKNILFANNEITTLMITIFSLGIALGSLICNKLLKGKISSFYTPFAAILMSIFIFDLYFTSTSQNFSSGDLIGFGEFIKTPNNLRILFDLAMIAICGGIYVVPLYAIIQNESIDENRARTIAALNIYDSLFMILSTIFALIILRLGFGTLEIFLATSVLNLIISGTMLKLRKQQKL